MDLETLYRLLEYQQGAERDREQVKIMTPDGRRYDVLSLSHDSEADEWVIVGE